MKKISKFVRFAWIGIISIQNESPHRAGNSPRVLANNSMFAYFRNGWAAFQEACEPNQEPETRRYWNWNQRNQTSNQNWRNQTRNRSRRNENQKK